MADLRTEGCVCQERLQLQREPQLPQLNKQQLFNITERTNQTQPRYHVANGRLYSTADKEDCSYIH